MKLTRFIWIILAIFSLGVPSCTTTGTGAYTGGVYGFPAPDRMSQQLQMQQAHSRVTRSLIPF